MSCLWTGATITTSLEIRKTDGDTVARRLSLVIDLVIIDKRPLTRILGSAEYTLPHIPRHSVRHQDDHAFP